ncbi:hypothetical protein N7E81_02720 [Reichenbachiella carrageenanivorans]|uniref:Uncharacterized protein n=1 Tax=Reichenbachiella carrageenanivorans TaxID=2979869 RepID=A0ABY6D278_9BACT|nr:hypothetical protein [Reichenbachiella carrageenanivorans]UXX80019.1 hypothetical protein N7E81_02720 [Reichenbachiella carrageenanivorans]
MRRTSFPILFVLCLVFYACKDNVVCPAFQSTYILDDSMRLAKYSYFANDSTPKFASVSKRTKYGMNKQMSLFRKNYELMTAPKKNVLAPVPEDTSELIIDQGEFVAEDFVDIDSIGPDSVSVAPLLAKAEEEVPQGPRYKYRYDPDASHNQEQVYYNKYYGELFIDKRPLPSEKTPEDEQLDESDTTQVKRKGLGGLFKRNKEEVEEAPVLDEKGEEAAEQEAEVPIEEAPVEPTEEEQ